jgi:crotonobetainyl-CoA:carnitine CoA-transferase CaiB-like acyl-CoA transferase
MKSIRILDLTRVLAGPWATQQLADQGADVIKIEAPQGDETRGFEPIVGGYSTYYQALNRNKRTITLDLKTAEGQAVLERLIPTADALMHNFRPGVAERLGIGWDHVHSTNPRLVYVAIHAYGEDADAQWVSRPGYDLVMQAMGGAMSITGFPDTPPVRCAVPVADTHTALLAVQAVLFGLLQREQTNRGQKIIINMMQAQAAALTYYASRYDVTKEPELPRGNAHRGLVPYDVYRCSDGWLAIATGNDGIWQRMRSALEIEDRVEWRTNPQRVANRNSLDAAVQEVLANLTMAEADARLAAVSVPAGPVQTVGEALNHPAVERVTVHHPEAGSLTMPGPIITTETTVSKHRAPPVMDEHRQEILDEIGVEVGPRRPRK